MQVGESVGRARVAEQAGTYQGEGGDVHQAESCAERPASQGQAGRTLQTVGREVVDQKAERDRRDDVEEGHEPPAAKPSYEATIDGEKVELYNDTVIAFERDGKEIFRTQIDEPLHLRPDKHANSI